MKQVLMAAIRKASLNYRDARGRNPKSLYLSHELASLLTGRWKHGFTNLEGKTGFVYDNDHCTLDICVASRELGKHFNCIGNDDDYQNAVTEHWLLCSTDSNSPIEEEYEKVSSSRDSNVVGIFCQRSRSVR